MNVVFCNFSGLMVSENYIRGKQAAVNFHQFLRLKAAKKLPKIKVRYVFQVDVKHFGCFCLGLYLF